MENVEKVIKMMYKQNGNINEVENLTKINIKR